MTLRHAKSLLARRLPAARFYSILAASSLFCCGILWAPAPALAQEASPESPQTLPAAPASEETALTSGDENAREQTGTPEAEGVKPENSAEDFQKYLQEPPPLPPPQPSSSPDSQVPPQNPQEEEQTPPEEAQEQQNQEAAAPVPAPGSTINAIQFTGLTRTKDSYLQRKYRRFIGKPADEENLHSLESGLRGEGLFETVKLSLVQLPGGGTAVQAAVKEKLTFIPLPFAIYSSSGFSAGGFIMDTNAFGVRDTFMVGGYYSPTAILGMAMLDIPARFDHIPGGSLFLSFAKNTPEINNLDNETILKYKNKALRANLRISERIDEHDTVFLGLNFHYIRADKQENPAEYMDTLSIGGIVMGWNYRKSDWNGWFNSLTEAQLQLTGSKYLNLGSDSSLSETTLNSLGYVYKEYPFIWPNLRLVGRFAVDFLWKGRKHSAHVAEYLDRRNVGISILPAYFRTDKIIGAYGGAELALYKFKYGMLSMYGNYEFAWTRDFSLEPVDDAPLNEFCHGPSGGVRFYLAKISFPALAIGVSYNVPRDYFQFSVAMGINR